MLPLTTIYRPFNDFEDFKTKVFDLTVKQIKELMKFLGKEAFAVTSTKAHNYTTIHYVRNTFVMNNYILMYQGDLKPEKLFFRTFYKKFESNFFLKKFDYNALMYKELHYDLSDDQTKTILNHFAQIFDSHIAFLIRKDSKNNNTILNAIVFKSSFKRYYNFEIDSFSQKNSWLNYVSLPNSKQVLVSANLITKERLRENQNIINTLPKIFSDYIYHHPKKHKLSTGYVEELSSLYKIKKEEATFQGTQTEWQLPTLSDKSNFELAYEIYAKSNFDVRKYAKLTKDAYYVKSKKKAKYQDDKSKDTDAKDLAYNADAITSNTIQKGNQDFLECMQQHDEQTAIDSVKGNQVFLKHTNHQDFLKYMNQHDEQTPLDSVVGNQNFLEYMNQHDKQNPIDIARGNQDFLKYMNQLNEQNPLDSVVGNQNFLEYMNQHDEQTPLDSVVGNQNFLEYMNQHDEQTPLDSVVGNQNFLEYMNQHDEQTPILSYDISYDLENLEDSMLV